jgi:thiol-disulfide isomerase/thioredoxin
MRKSLAFLLLFLLVMLFACDETDSPYIDSDNTFVILGLFDYESDFFENYESTVLLEDFTGYRCTNCLPAIETAENLQEKWGDRLTVVAYHVTSFFAAPLPTPEPPFDAFSEDFRSDDGTDLFGTTGIQGLPNGMVNRFDFGTGSVPQGAGTWEENVSEEMAKAPVAFLELQADSVVVNGLELSFTVSFKPLTEIEGPVNLILGIYESSLIEGQKNGGVTIYPFTHNHVFRKNINGVFGQEVLPSGLTFSENEAIFYKFNTEISDEWNTDNCYVFAFLQSIQTEKILASAKVPF